MHKRYDREYLFNKRINEPIEGNSTARAHMNASVCVYAHMRANRPTPMASFYTHTYMQLNKHTLMKSNAGIFVTQWAKPQALWISNGSLHQLKLIFKMCEWMGALKLNIKAFYKKKKSAKEQLHISMSKFPTISGLLKFFGEHCFYCLLQTWKWRCAKFSSTLPTSINGNSILSR